MHPGSGQFDPRSTRVVKLFNLQDCLSLVAQISPLFCSASHASKRSISGCICVLRYCHPWTPMKLSFFGFGFALCSGRIEREGQSNFIGLRVQQLRRRSACERSSLAWKVISSRCFHIPASWRSVVLQKKRMDMRNAVRRFKARIQRDRSCSAQRTLWGRASEAIHESLPCFGAIEVELLNEEGEVKDR